MSVRLIHTTDSRPSPTSTTLFQATGTALTGSYVTLGESEFIIDGATSAFLHVYWTKGDETSIEIRALYRLRSGGAQAQSTIITTSASTSVLAPVEWQTTTTGNFIIPFGTEGRFVTFQIKATGGTPTGTYGAGIYVDRE